MAPDESGESGQESPAEKGGGLFREQAVAYHLGESEEGEVLRLSPSWTRWTYWLLIAVVLGGLVYLMLGRAPVWQVGSAILRVEGRTSIVAEAAGTVDGVEVRPGQRVERGAVLVRLGAAREQAERAKFEQEFELQLIERLKDPSNEAAGRELRRLRGELELIEARLEERLVRAPSDGVVSDIRIRPGQPLAFGDEVLALVEPDPEYSVIILFPGQARPSLRSEMAVRLEIEGYPYAYVSAEIAAVGDQVIGPSEARRFLGPGIADSVTLTGPVVVVEGRLATGTFTSWEREYSLHDGMLARAKVAVRTEPLLFRLIPGLRALG
jgi:membrane fusion protein (multidrug efflux system)